MKPPRDLSAGKAYVTLIVILSASAVWVWGSAIYTLFAPLR